MRLLSHRHTLHLSRRLNQKRKRDVIWPNSRFQHLGIEPKSPARFCTSGEAADEQVEDEKIRVLNLREDSVCISQELGGFVECGVIDAESEDTTGNEDVGDEMSSYEKAMDDLEVGEGRTGLEQGKLRVFETKCVEHNVAHSLQKVPKSLQLYKNLTYNGRFLFMTLANRFVKSINKYFFSVK